MIARIGNASQRAVIAVIVIVTLLAVALPVQPVAQAAPAAQGMEQFDFPVSLAGSQISNNRTRVVTGDFSGDGAIDLVILPYDAPGLYYRNDGRGRFVSERSLPTALADSAGVGDFNGDGKLDIVIGSTLDLKIMLNNGPEQFVQPTIIVIDTGFPVNDLAVADFNNDGAQDIAVITLEGSIHQYLNKNDRSGTFEEGTILSDILSSKTDIAAGDFNNDGAPDLVISSDSVRPGAIYLNVADGTGDFKAPTAVDGGGLFVSVVAGDFNNDGWLDLVFGGRFGSRDRLYLNQGNGQFTPTIELQGTTTTSSDLSTADFNGDGRLDVLRGHNEVSQVILNLDDGFGEPQNLPGIAYSTTDTASADFDDDGSPDIVLANVFTASRVFRNRGPSSIALANVLPNSAYADNVALGDLDGDGALDLVRGGSFYVSKTLRTQRNDGDGTFEPEQQMSNTPVNVNDLALCDLNGDSALDLVHVGPFSSQVRFNPNDRTVNFSKLVDLPQSHQAASVVCGDLNGDGALDVVVSYYSAVPQVFINTNDNGVFLPPVPLPGDIWGTSLALGDLNRDGALDLVLGVVSGPSQVYLNTGSGAFLPSVALPDFGVTTTAVAVADFNGDGVLDILVGKRGEQSQLIFRSASGAFSMPMKLIGSGKVTLDVGVGDLNGDGVIDIVLANDDGPSQLFFNQGNGTFLSPIAQPGATAPYNLANEIALGDINRDGTLDMVLANSAIDMQVYTNHLRHSARLPNNPPRVVVRRPVPTKNADFFSTPVILDSPTVAIDYTLADQESDSVAFIRASFSVDGGGRWQPARPISTTQTLKLATSPQGVQHTYVWDVQASGLFGLSDNVVFRIQAYPGPASGAGSVSEPSQQAYVAGSTFPFRVRGSQVRVVNEQAAGVQGALVLRSPSGGQEFQPIAGADSQTFSTDQRGVLRGRGEIVPGDQLVALQPIAATAAFSSTKFTTYLTSAQPNNGGLDAFPVRDPGVQTLVIPQLNSPAQTNLLTTLNLAVSLEWDASGDAPYLSQLRADLLRTSELLYDWTDGQFALGSVRVLQNKAEWDTADIQIAASNRLRPNANQGGIVMTDTVDLDVPTVSYSPGHVRIGATWNRYGEAGGTLGEDWPRALAHELGHYALFLDDNYLGLVDGRISLIEGCPGAMSDPYRGDYSEFVPTDEAWRTKCAGTLSQQTTGRSDWATIERFYQFRQSSEADFHLKMRAPERYNANPGPARLALAVTAISIDPVVPPPVETPFGVFTTPATPAPPLLSLVDAENSGQRYQPSASARTFLFPRGAARLLDLGTPVLGQVIVRGANYGDAVCVYDLNPADLDNDRIGCTTIVLTSTVLAMRSPPDHTWNPDVQITPQSARYVEVAVAADGVGVRPNSLRVEVYPLDAPAVGSPQGLISGTLVLSDSVYRGVVDLGDDVTDAYVRVTVPSDGRRQIVTEYSLGGSPAPRKRTRAKKNRRAPTTSADGQVVLYVGDVTFPTSSFYAIQTATRRAANPPPWTVPVGQSYRLLASDNAPPLETLKASLNIAYLEDDLVAGTEGGIGVYYLPPGATQWQVLTATRSLERNELVAPVRGPGTYALMTSLNLRQGWNLFSYPFAGNEPVASALSQMNGSRSYRLIYGYDEQDSDDPWKVYAAGVPTWVNDLEEFQYGRGYWVYAQTAAPVANTAQRRNVQLTTPPSTFYGLMPEGANVVSATIGGTVCGETTSREVPVSEAAPLPTQRVFVIDVLADGVDDAVGCGKFGDIISLAFLDGEGVVRSATVFWNNNLVQTINTKQVFLPLAGIPAPSTDLTIDTISVLPAVLQVGQATEVRVIIRNSGTTNITAPFWVDLYVDPTEPPEPDQTWPDVSDYGASWRVYGLRAGETLVLSTLRPNDPLNPTKQYSNFTTFTSGGTHELYAQIDTYAPDSGSGAVAEGNEKNNTRGPLVVQVDGTTPRTRATPPAVDQRVRQFGGR